MTKTSDAETLLTVLKSQFWMQVYWAYVYALLIWPVWKIFFSFISFCSVRIGGAYNSAIKQGPVQFYRNGTWYNLCDTGFDDVTAKWVLLSVTASLSQGSDSTPLHHLVPLDHLVHTNEVQLHSSLCKGN